MFPVSLNYGSWYRPVSGRRIRRCNPGTIKEFSIEFLTNRNSESRSTQNFNFNLFSIKSKPTSRYEPVSQFKGLPSAHFINRYRILAHTSIKVKLPSTSINASGLRSTQNLNYNLRMIKSKVGISRPFRSTYFDSTNRKASIAQTTIKVKLFQKLKKGNFLCSTTEATSLTRPPIKVKAARVSPGSL